MLGQDHLPQVRRVLEAVTPIPEQEWAHAQQFIGARAYAKGEHLLAAGEMATHSYVILSGIVRTYYTTEDGKEFNKGFAAEDQFAGSVSSIIAKLPSRFSIQALEPTRVALLPRASIEAMYDRHRCWDRLGRVIAESALVMIERRDGERLDPLEVRYRRLLDEVPTLSSRVAQYHIASYLGVTDVALSRLRGRMKERGEVLDRKHRHLDRG